MHADEQAKQSTRRSSQQAPIPVVSRVLIHISGGGLTVSLGGAAPVTESIFSPFLNAMNVGMALICSSLAIS